MGGWPDVRIRPYTRDAAVLLWEEVRESLAEAAEWTRAHLRKRWTDSKKWPLEDVLNDVVLGLVLVADAKRAGVPSVFRPSETSASGRRHSASGSKPSSDAARSCSGVTCSNARSNPGPRPGRSAPSSTRWSDAPRSKGTAAEPGTELGDWITWARQHADRLDPSKPPIHGVLSAGVRALISSRRGNRPQVTSLGRDDLFKEILPKDYAKSITRLGVPAPRNP